MLLREGGFMSNDAMLLKIIALRVINSSSKASLPNTLNWNW